MKKNDCFQIQIEDMSDTGEGIGKVEGFTWFVKDAVIGDTVTAKVMKTKKSYGFARLVQVVEPSPHRVIPLCPVAKQCGGCQLQALSYEAQLRFKEQKIRNNLKRIGDFSDLDVSVIGMEEPWRYRNKAQFPFGRNRNGEIIAGFYAGRTHSIIEQEDCFIGVGENPEILCCIKDYMEEFQISPYEEESHTGLVRHALIRKGFRTGEIMVCLVINGKVSDLKQKEVLVERLTRLFGSESDFSDSQVVSISASINRERTNVIMGQQMEHVYGPGYITDFIGSVQYRISPLSFYQVNPIQTQRLYETALEFAGLTGGEIVWDLYCGIGTISLFLAQKAKRVYGVELVPQAIEDARENARLNGMDNVEFFVGKAEEVLPEQFKQHQIHGDVIVVDPPRKGCDQLCLDTIVQMEPEKVVYVSCDSATLARDLRYLADRGYGVTRVQGLDLFPQGGHVETVVLLSLKSGTPKIEVTMEVDSDSNYSPEEKATYQKIKEYVKDKYGVNVHTRYIAEVKRMCGIDMGENYNKSKKDNPDVKHCPQEKAEYIKDALRYFDAI